MSCVFLYCSCIPVQMHPVYQSSLDKQASKSIRKTTNTAELMWGKKAAVIGQKFSNSLQRLNQNLKAARLRNGHGTHREQKKKSNGPKNT